MEVKVQASRDYRRATNESVHRTVNERRELAALLGPATDASLRCECECHRAKCGSSFIIRLIDYEAVRAVGTRFVVAPGHQSDEELLIASTGAFSVVEKTGEQAQISNELNPR